MSEIRLDSVEVVDGTTCVCRADADFRAGRYFDRPVLEVDYPVDVSDVDESILAIPFVANVCTLAWVTGHDLVVDSLDRRFAESLPTVRRGYREMFDEAGVEQSLDGEVVVSETVENPAVESDRSATLFTGGVDSVATLLRKRDERPALLCFREAESEDQWRAVRDNVRTYADAFDTEAYFLEVTKDLLDYPRLNKDFRHLGRSYFGALQYPPGYVGLCAPLTQATGIGRVYQSAGYTYDTEHPESRPSIVDPIGWAGTECRLDAYDLTRQEKQRLIASELDPDLDVDVVSCTDGDDGLNCNACEKCYRNVLGMLAAGSDPTAFGYRADDDLLAEIRLRLREGSLTLSRLQAKLWEDIRTDVDVESFPGDPEFAEWFASADPFDYVEPYEDVRLKYRLWQRLPYPIDAWAERAHSRMAR